MYKVLRLKDNKFISSSNFNPITYKVNEPTTPKHGKIFLFDTMEDVFNFYYNPKEELFIFKVNPENAKKAKWMCMSSFTNRGKDFWNVYTQNKILDYPWSFPAPSGTYYADSITIYRHNFVTKIGPDTTICPI